MLNVKHAKIVDTPALNVVRKLANMVLPEEAKKGDHGVVLSEMQTLAKKLVRTLVLPFLHIYFIVFF